MNIFDLPKLPLNEELTSMLANGQNVRIERIISCGQVTDWYDQAESEFVILLEGMAKLEYGNKEIITLNKGDTILINPHEKHRVVYTSAEPLCIWLCVFF
jgi:cupin 2 domain-containing protein